MSKTAWDELFTSRNDHLATTHLRLIASRIHNTWKKRHNEQHRMTNTKTCDLHAACFWSVKTDLLLNSDLVRGCQVVLRVTRPPSSRCSRSAACIVLWRGGGVLVMIERDAEQTAIGWVAAGCTFKFAVFTVKHHSLIKKKSFYPIFETRVNVQIGSFFMRSKIKIKTAAKPSK